MRAYLIEAPGARRYAGTSADARQTREDLMQQRNCKKKDVTIEGVEVPTAKDALLEFINGFCVELDSANDA